MRPPYIVELQTKKTDLGKSAFLALPIHHYWAAYV